MKSLVTSPDAARNVATAVARGGETLGLLLGLVGVIAFRLTLPMTRFAVAELDPWFLAFGRMSIAGVLAAAWLLAIRAPRRRVAMSACSHGARSAS